MNPFSTAEMETGPRDLLPKVGAIVVGAVVLAGVACGGSSTDQATTQGPTLCGTEPLPPCPPFGQPVSLEIETGPLPDFPPLPDARAAAYPGETVNVTAEGFRPGEETEVLSTDERYSGTRYSADDDGSVQIPVLIGSSATPGQSYFIVMQEAASGEPLLASFAIVTLDHGAARELQGELLEDALGLADSGDGSG